MGKIADKYYKTDPWLIIEEGFNPEYAQVSESIFALANEYMGVRGYFEEGYSGHRLQGSYVNGIYEKRSLLKSGYKGMIDETEYMVNTVDWLSTQIYVNHVLLDLAKAEITNYVRKLDLRTGLLTRSFIWRVDEKTRVEMTFERFLSMTHPELAAQKIMIKSIEGEAHVQLIMALDFSQKHESVGPSLWQCHDQILGENYLSITGRSKTTDQYLRATCLMHQTGKKIKSLALNPNVVAQETELILGENESVLFERIAKIEKWLGHEHIESSIENVIDDLSRMNFSQLFQDNKHWWEKQWDISDILISGDEENQQGIRFCIFQMHQTLHTADHTSVIGAKGLTGEAYNGNTFWDTEIYCLPFYLFNNPQAAKTILDFRYDTLDEAKKRAEALDLKGAFYPVATISGTECCDLWQHASLQLQASTAVMYGIKNYVETTGDFEYLYSKGLEMLVEICRMLGSRGDFSPKTGLFGYYGVMGPDEFQMMVNHNTYTNYMAKRTFEFTLDSIQALKDARKADYDNLVHQCGLTEIELLDWADKASKMTLLYDDQTHLFEQHDGYFDLPLLKIDDIPIEDFPLYSHWSYERIYRNSMLKQPDVLMFLLLYRSEFAKEVIEANFDFYEPRCIHESSLSPSVHSILACHLGRTETAFDFFKFATRMDLDNYNRNSHEGLHTTSIAGSWMNIVYGFGGLNHKGTQIYLNPTIPSSWTQYQFKLKLGQKVLEVSISQDWVELKCNQNDLEVILYGEAVLLNTIGIKKPMQRGDA